MRIPPLTSFVYDVIVEKALHEVIFSFDYFWPGNLYLGGVGGEGRGGASGPGQLLRG